MTIMKGIIMSCAIQPPNVHRNQTKRGTARFHQILISESAHLIGKIRNDHVINDKLHYTLNEIEQRWIQTINCCMKLDCILSDQRKFGRKAIQKSLVLKMWQGTLLNESTLPEDWTKENGVLVGIIK